MVASSSKEPALEDLLSLDLARGEGKTQKNWVTLSAFVKKIWKSSEFYTRRYEFWSASPARLWDSCERNLSLYHKNFKSRYDTFYFELDSRICAQVGTLSEQKELKTGRFYSLSDARWKKGKGTAVEDVLKKSGLPNSLSLTSAKDKQVLALSYQVTDGLVSLTFERDQTGQYRLTKKG